MSRADELRKLLADEYNIHSDEELANAYKVLKTSMDDFMFLFGKENYEKRKENHNGTGRLARGRSGHIGDGGNVGTLGTEPIAGTALQHA